MYVLTPALSADVVKRNESRVLATEVDANPMEHMPIYRFNKYIMQIKLYFNFENVLFLIIKKVLVNIFNMKLLLDRNQL